MGRNGAGKTTMLKSLLRTATGAIDDAERRSRSTAGNRVSGSPKCRVGYFAQDLTDSIAKNTTVVEWLHQFDPPGGAGGNCAACWAKCSLAARMLSSPLAPYPAANRRG